MRPWWCCTTRPKPGRTWPLTVALDVYDFDGEPVSLVVVSSGRGTVTATEGHAATVSARMGASEGIEIAFNPGTDFDHLAAGETAGETVTLVVADSKGVCTTTSFESTVTGADDAPTLAAGSLGATEDGPVVALDLAPLGDDTDSDDDGSTLTCAVTGQPGAGSASVTGTTLSIDPGSDFQDLGEGETRDATVGITATDAHGATATNTVTVTVTGVDDAQVAVDDHLPGSLREDAVAMVLAPVLLFHDTDPDGDPLTVTAFDAISAEGAAVTVNADGSVVFDPTGAPALQALGVGESAVDSFTCTISDGNVGTGAARVSITVTGVNGAPTAVDNLVTRTGDTELNEIAPGVMGNDHDVDGDPLTVTAFDATSAGGRSGDRQPRRQLQQRFDDLGHIAGVERRREPGRHIHLHRLRRQRR